MNNIIRREPIQRYIPREKDLDDVRTVNLNKFKGLQVFDNPLLADTSSAQSSKNVYRDGMGNLTVRPRLIPSTTEYSGEVLGIYKTGNGEFVHYDGLIVGPNGNLTIDVETNVVVQEFKSGTYFFIRKDEKLAFYKYVDSFELVEGEVPLVDTTNPNTAAYNILNDKQIYRQYYTLQPSPNIMTNDEYMLLKTSETEFKTGTLAIGTVDYEVFKTRVIYINDTTTLTIMQDVPSDPDDVSSTPADVAILTRYISTTSVIKSVYVLPLLARQFPGDGDSTRYAGRIGCTLYSTHAELIMGNYIDNLDAPLASELEFARVQIPYTGRDAVVEVINTWATSPNQFYVRAVNCLDNGYVLFTLMHASSPAYLAYSGGLFADITWNYVPVNYDVTWFTTQKQYVGALAYQSSQGVIVSQSLTNNAWLTGAIEYQNGFLKVVGQTNANGAAPVGELDNRILALRDNKIVVWTAVTAVQGTGLAVTEQDYLEVFGATHVNAYQHGNNTCIVSYYTDNKYQVDVLSGTDGLRYTYAGTRPEHSNVREIFMSANFKILSYVKRFVDTWYITGFTTEFRQLGYFDTEETRNTDKIPTLSQIDDYPVTGFFLDNSYWFVARNHIFGTGVPVSPIEEIIGQTIEYWQPRKYHEVTERITAAIRVADTSFWVLHNDGAYLLYKTIDTTNDVQTTFWPITATAKSKGCDFENAVVTLPISNYVATVTSVDICSVQMRKNIQSDERSLIPMTLKIEQFILDLLAETTDIKVGNYKYYTLFACNQSDSKITPVIVFDNQTNEWWYWSFPVERINQLNSIEDNIELLCVMGNKSNVFTLSENYFEQRVNLLNYIVYCDKLSTSSNPLDTLSAIPWYWESAIQMFGTTEFYKQLLFTNFVLTDFHERQLIDGVYKALSTDCNFDYLFKVFTKDYSETPSYTALSNVSQIQNTHYRTLISKFNYLQLRLQNRETEDIDDIGSVLETYTKPKLANITFKYRISQGVLI